MATTRVRLLPIVFYVLLIFLVSSIPDFVPPGPRFMLRDKVAHFVEYFILGLLLFRGARWEISRSRIATLVFLCAIGASVGALDEFYQSLIPGREMDVRDWMADVFGTMCGVGIFVFTGLGGRPDEP